MLVRLTALVACTLFSAFGGGIIAALLTHLLALWRERLRDADQRKREFRGYLAELRSRIERIDHEKTMEVFLGYTSLVHQFHRERARVARDYKPRVEFDRLCSQLGELRYGAVTSDPKGRQPRDVIAEAIDALVRFTKDR